MKRNRTRIAVTVVLCVAALAYMALLTTLNLRHVEEVIVRQTQQYVLAVARAKAEHLSHVVQTIGSELHVFASGPAVHSMLAERLRPPHRSETPSLWTNSPVDRLVSAVHVLDADGQVVWSQGGADQAIVVDVPLRIGLRAVLQGAPLHVGEVFQSPEGDMAVSLCLPVTLNDKVAGAVVAVIHTATLAELIGGMWGAAHNYVWLLDDDGQVLTHPDAGFAGRSVFILELHDLGTEAQSRRAVANMLSGREGVTGALLNRRAHRRTMMAWSPVIVGNERWALATCVDYDGEVAAPMRIHAQNTFIMLGCFVLALLAGGFVYYRIGRREAHLHARHAIGRVTDELQNLSLEQESRVDRLRDDVRRLRGILQALPWPICWKDDDGVFQGCNEAFARRVGLGHPDDIVGMTEGDLSGVGKLQEVLWRGDDEVRRTGIALLNLEVQVPAADGPAGRVLLSKIPLREGSRVTGLLTACVDLGLSSDRRPGSTEEKPTGDAAPSEHLQVPEQTTTPPPAAPDESRSPSSAAESSNGSILIVDDVRENAMLLDILLRKAGYRTRLCADGKEAVEAAAGEAFDVILMDIQMPRMDGLEATAAIRATGANRRTAILAMTASLERSEELACLQAGCDDCVRKPIKSDLLLRKVWRLVQQNRQRQQAAEGQPIVSFLADDPDYTKAVEKFVSHLPERVAQMQEDFQRGALKELALKLHSFKGVGGLAGFPVLSEKAEMLEDLIESDQVDQIAAQLDDLVQLCRRTHLSRS